MKKLLLSFFCITVIALGGCIEREDNDKETADMNFDGVIVQSEDVIPTKPLWQGLSVTLEKDLPPFGSLVFMEKEHYEEFAREYFSWTNGEVSADVAEIDFSKEAIIFTASGKARPFRAVSSQVKAYAVLDGKLEAFFESEGTPGIVDTAETEETIEIYSIHLDIVKKDDLPEDFPQESIFKGFNKEGNTISKVEDFDLENQTISVERPNKETFQIPLDELPEVKHFLEEQGDHAEFQFDRITTSYLLNYNGKEYINIGYNCGQKLCTHLVVEYDNEVTDSRVILETGMFVNQVYANDPYVALMYAINEGTEVVRNKVVIVDLNQLEILSVPKEAQALHSFEYPILSLEWKDSNLVGTIPDVQDTTYESIKKWIDSSNQPTKTIEWEL